MPVIYKLSSYKMLIYDRSKCLNTISFSTKTFSHFHWLSIINAKQSKQHTNISFSFNQFSGVKKVPGDTEETY